MSRNKDISSYWPFRLLRTFCPPFAYEEIAGDLTERFNRDVDQVGKRTANRRLIWNVLRFFRPGIVMRNKFSMRLNQLDMITHFVKIFWRTSLKNPSYSFINVAGLAVGISASVLVGLYVQAEKSYDQFHAKKDRVFRIRHDRFTGGALTRQWAAGPMGIGADLKNNFPEVKRFVMLNRGVYDHYMIANRERIFKENQLLYASADFFRLFSYPLVKGVDSLALRDPFTMVVSESFARKYFDDEEPIGKTLVCNGKEPYVITGVFKDVPDNTHLKFDALFSFESLIRILGPEEVNDLITNWGWEGNFTYVELADGTSYKALQAKLPAFVERKMGTVLRSWNEWMEFTLQPLTTIHLNSHAPDEWQPGGDEKAVNFLSWTAVLILIMAWINYVNLATAKSLERAKEVGIRKVLGSERGRLIRQFLCESFAINAVGLLIAIILVNLLLPAFSSLVQRDINATVFQSVRLWMTVGVTFTIGVFISGAYPALIMSRFLPASVTKGNFKHSMKGVLIRRILVTAQFGASIVLIIVTYTVYQQVQFMTGTPRGVSTEQVLALHGPTATDSTYHNRFQTFIHSLVQHSSIESVTVSTDVPGQRIHNTNGNVRLVGQDVKEGNTFQAIMTDENFVSTYGLTLIAGRNFSGNPKDQWKSVIVNETAMKQLGFADPAQVIGRKMYLWDSEPEIIGVIKDYHQEYLKNTIKPFALVYDQEVSDFYSVKLKDRQSVSTAIEFIEREYKKAFPGNTFDFFFLDSHYDQQYRFDRQFGKIAGLFTLLAMFIASLGLFGLSSYSVIQRMKEISIRKVLGASVAQIASLISREFIYIVIAACLLSSPLAFYFMNDWLSGFAFHISINGWLFFIPALIVFVIALLTVSAQSAKAALSNPVDNLKNE